MQVVQETLTWLWPLLAVFAARVVVTMFEVAKVTFTARGQRAGAAIMAVIDSTLWLTIVAAIINSLTPGRVAAYAAGVGAGTWLASYLIAAARLGFVTVEAYCPLADPNRPRGADVANAIRELGFGATVFRGEGAHGPVDVVKTVAQRRRANVVVDRLREVFPRVFVVVDSAPGPGSRISGISGPHRL